jgi:anti-sigma-K factor RskA
VNVDGTPATFVVSKSLDKAMFVGADLPAAAQGRTYQLWTLDSAETPKAAETFAGGPDTTVFMSGDIAAAAALAVTNEPEGGSTKPTLPILASTAL